MLTIGFFLLLIAAVCFLAAAFNARSVVNLTALGLFCWVLSLLLR